MLSTSISNAELEQCYLVRGSISYLSTMMWKLINYLVYKKYVRQQLL